MNSTNYTLYGRYTRECLTLDSTSTVNLLLQYSLEVPNQSCLQSESHDKTMACVLTRLLSWLEIYSASRGQTAWYHGTLQWLHSFKLHFESIQYKLFKLDVQSVIKGDALGDLYLVFGVIFVRRDSSWVLYSLLKVSVDMWLSMRSFIVTFKNG